MNGKPIRGVGCGSFVLPSDLPDGDYTLVLRELPLSAVHPAMVPTPAVRPIKVHSTPNDIHQKNIVLLGRSFAPGDTVHGYAELSLQDQPVAGAEVEAIATADGVLFDSIQGQPKTGPDGRVNLQFTLPRQLDRGDVRLQVTFKSTWPGGGSGDRHGPRAGRGPAGEGRVLPRRGRSRRRRRAASTSAPPRPTASPWTSGARSPTAADHRQGRDAHRHGRGREPGPRIVHLHAGDRYARLAEARCAAAN